jgi:CelD/BcsL family acetyltransferase involved in cellulose biosynthesis
LAVLGVFDDAGELRGIAPWYVDHSALQGRVLRPMGSGEVCSDYLGVLCDPPVEDAVAKALAGYLVDCANDRSPDALRWDLLDTDAVDAEDSVMAALVGHLSAYGCTVHRRPGMNCWRLNLATDWDKYLASLGRHLRSDLRRLSRDMFDTGRAMLCSPAGLDDLPRAMDILVDLHQRRWTAVGEPGCFASERFNAFFRDVVPAMQRLGQLQFHWLELDGRPIAARYELIVDGVVYAYQSGVDPDMRKHEPGKLMNMAILREAIDRGHRTFDFLRGNEPYKAQFGAQARPTIRFRVVPRGAVAQLRQKLWLARYRAKEWAKSRVKKTAK